jgi:hypothetical protein
MGSGSIASLFLTPEVDEGEWSASRLCRFTPWDRAPGTPSDKRLGGHTAELDAVEKRNSIEVPVTLIKHNAMKTYGGVDV